MTDMMILLTVLAAWFVLNIWVLPRLGMNTCLSGFCHINSDPKSLSEQNRVKSDSESVQPNQVQDSNLPQTGELK